MRAGLPTGYPAFSPMEASAMPTPAPDPTDFVIIASG